MKRPGWGGLTSGGEGEESVKGGAESDEGRSAVRRAEQHGLRARGAVCHRRGVRAAAVALTRSWLQRKEVI